MFKLFLYVILIFIIMSNLINDLFGFVKTLHIMKDSLEDVEKISTHNLGTR